MWYDDILPLPHPLHINLSGSLSYTRPLSFSSLLRPVLGVKLYNFPNLSNSTALQRVLNFLLDRFLSFTFPFFLSPFIQRPLHCRSAITTTGFPDLARGDQGGQASTSIPGAV